MKSKLSALVLAAIGILAGVVVLTMGGTATAAIPSRTTPYPNVPINSAVCQAQAIQVQQAENNYNAALANYNRTLTLYRRSAASAYQLRTDQAAVDAAGIALNDAKYAQAACQNNAAAPADRNCTNLTLELNRLIDNLAYTRDLEAIATANYQMAQRLYAQRAMSQQEFQSYQTAYQNAVLQTRLVQQQITDQRARTTAAGCENVDRPAQVCNDSTNSSNLSYLGRAAVVSVDTVSSTSIVSPTDPVSSTSIVSPTDTVSPTSIVSPTDTVSPTETPTSTSPPTWTDPEDTWTDTTAPDTCIPTTTSTP